MRFQIWMISLAIMLPIRNASASETLSRYYGHDAVEDQYGVIAPWYTRQNGQFDFRIQSAAEQIKRRPYGKSYKAQTVARGLFALTEYYRYSGDPAAIARLTVIADTLLECCQTSEGHPWPQFLVSLPYGVDAKHQDKVIQLDIVGETGTALLHAYQLTGNERWLDAVKHWADVLVKKRNHAPLENLWPRYVDPDSTAIPWTKRPTGNRMTGGIIYILAMFDELIELGYTGEDDALVRARDDGRAYLREVLLPAWVVNDTWGRNYNDWENPVQAQTTTNWVVRYLINNKSEFPNWKNDARNILSLFLNHSCASVASRGEVYSGAWAFPEGCACCGTSLVWGPMEFAVNFAQYGVEARSEWARELARRMEILATYDVTESGVGWQDKIGGGVEITGGIMNDYSMLKLANRTMSWLPGILGPNRENHLMRSTEVVNSVSYRKDKVGYSTFMAPANTVDVLRLAFRPESVTTDTEPLGLRQDLDGNGYVVKALQGGDFIVSIRHDGHTKVVVTGNDPQLEVDDNELKYSGDWMSRQEVAAIGSELHQTSTEGASAVFPFSGNQVRLIGSVGPDGGMAEVYIDNVKQRDRLDFWNPGTLHQQLVYLKNGLADGEHTLKIVILGKSNKMSNGQMVCLDAVQYSSADGDCGWGEGGGSTNTQRMIFGYTNRVDYRDSQGNLWKPATEFFVRVGTHKDSVANSWWTMKRTEQQSIDSEAEEELYNYGVYGPEIVVNVTVGPGDYYAKLIFAETQFAAPNQRGVTIKINGMTVAEKMDVFSIAGGFNQMVQQVYKDIQPKNGMIEVRLLGDIVNGTRRDAFINALEVGPGDAKISANVKSDAGR